MIFTSYQIRNYFSESRKNYQVEGVGYIFPTSLVFINQIYRIVGNIIKPEFMAKKKRRLNSEVNAGSMADIAFLLLIFFLVTTQIDTDKGILVKLPVWTDDPVSVDLIPRNVFSIKVNRENQLLVEGEVDRLEGIRAKVKEFVLNPQKKPNLSTAPKNAVVSLQNDRGTSYSIYLGVYNEIKAAYNELWEEESSRRYGIAYVDLPYATQKEIRNIIPSIISESEPTEF